MDTIRRLIVRMATENREWGDTRIRGALGNLGHQVARGPPRQRAQGARPRTRPRTQEAHDLAGVSRGPLGRARRRRLLHCRGLDATWPGPLFRPAVRDTLPPVDVTPLRRPARSPNLNAYTERCVRTIKDSCLERMVLIGEGSRRRAVHEFVAHDHHERNHQGLDKRRILPLSTAPPPRGRVPCRQRLGGMLHDDYRSAA